MSDPFAKSARRIVERVGTACVFTRLSDGERVANIKAVLDRDVELIDDLGQVVDRDDMVQLLVEDVGVPKSGDTVEFTDSGDVYTLGRTVKDDGYVAKLMAQKNA